MRVRVIAVGKHRKSLFGDATGDYAGRLSRYLPFEIVRIPPSRRSEPDRARREEAERILAAHGQGRRLMLLAPSGEALSSETLARLMERLMQEGRDVDLVIGGDEGLDPSLRRSAERRLSLGPMTLPHQLALVVLVEQLYRAMTIIRGEPYHK